MEREILKEKNIGMTEKLKKIGEAIVSYKDALVSHLKDMDVEVKD